MSNSLRHTLMLANISINSIGTFLFAVTHQLGWFMIALGSLIFSWLGALQAFNKEADRAKPAPEISNII